MARYKHTDAENGQGMFLTVNLKDQLTPGTFEYMLDDLVGGKIDVSGFDKNYRNDITGAKAIPPAALVKLIIYGYSKGMKSSRKLDELGRNNVVAKALTADLEPHWTTIAEFISGNGETFKEIFVKVLAYCGELGLIGGKAFALDGLRLPSNASIGLSGTAEELEKKLTVYRRMAGKHVAKHRRQDERGETSKQTEELHQKRQKHLNRQIEKISGFLDAMEKREGKRGHEIKSNVTDNESAMIMSSEGYIQGYIGLAVSDSQNQIIITADAVGSANECEHLPQMLEETLGNIKEAPEGTKRTLLADGNYFSEENLKACEAKGIEAIIPDSQYKRRLGENKEKRYGVEDFTYHESGDYYECPQGKKLECKRKQVFEGREAKTYEASVKDCRCCPLNSRCIKARKANARERGRRLMITGSNEPGSLCGALREKLNSEEYQDRYACRIQIIEPVFANISYCKGLDRFTLRGKKKVNGQWRLYCMVHNLGKCLKGYNAKKGYA